MGNGQVFETHEGGKKPSGDTQQESVKSGEFLKRTNIMDSDERNEFQLTKFPNLYLIKGISLMVTSITSLNSVKFSKTISHKFSKKSKTPQESLKGHTTSLNQ